MTVRHPSFDCHHLDWAPINANVFDWDGDYNVTVTDFLMMLSVYGDTDIDLDGIWDSSDVCVDLEACNYSAEPSEPCAYIDVPGFAVVAVKVMKTMTGFVTTWTLALA